MWNECNCVVVWTFFSIALLRDWNESWAFPVLWPLLSFPNLLAYWMQHFKSIILRKKKKRKYLLSIDCVPGTRLYVLHRRCCISSWSYCTYFVAEKIEVQRVPVFLDEIHSSGNGYAAEVDGSIHIENDAALVRNLHFLLPQKEFSYPLKIYSFHNQVQELTIFIFYTVQPIAVFDFSQALDAERNRG